MGTGARGAGRGGGRGGRPLLLGAEVDVTHGEAAEPHREGRGGGEAQQYRDGEHRSGDGGAGVSPRPHVREIGLVGPTCQHLDFIWWRRYVRAGIDWRVD